MLREDVGSLYEGEFKLNLPHGYGRMLFGLKSDFDYYVGDWEDGKRHG